MLDAGASEDVILTIADQMGPCDLRTLSQRSNISEEEILERLGLLIDSEEIVALGEMGAQADAVVYSRRGWDILRNQAQVALQAYHNQYPLRRGAPPQELRSRLRVSQPVYLRAAARLVDEGAIAEDNGLVRASDHRVELSDSQQTAIAQYLAYPRRRTLVAADRPATRSGTAVPPSGAGRRGEGQRIGGVHRRGLRGYGGPHH